MRPQPMPRRRPAGEEGTTGGESAVDLGDAFQRVAKALGRLQEALQLQGLESERKLQEAMRRQQQEAERRLQEAMRQQEQKAERMIQEAMQQQEREVKRRIQKTLRHQEQRAASAVQMETKLQEKDDVVRAQEQRLKDAQQRVTVERERTDGCVEGGALRRQVQEGERTLQEALRLQQQRAATALPEAVAQIDAKLQKNEVFHTLGQRLKESQERVAVVEESEKGFERSAGNKALGRLEENKPRVAIREGKAEDLAGSAEEGTLRQPGHLPVIVAFVPKATPRLFPPVDGIQRPLEIIQPSEAATSSKSVCPSAEEPPLKADKPPPSQTSCATTCTSSTSISPGTSSLSSSGDGDFRATATDRQEETGACQGSAAERDELQRQRAQLRIEENKKKMLIAHARKELAELRKEIRGERAHGRSGRAE